MELIGFTGILQIEKGATAPLSYRPNNICITSSQPNKLYTLYYLFFKYFINNFKIYTETTTNTINKVKLII